MLFESLEKDVEGWKGADFGVGIPIPRFRFFLKEDAGPLGLGLSRDLGKFHVFLNIINPVCDSAERRIGAVEFVGFGDLEAGDSGWCRCR